jgi:hypothetical protein
VAPRYLRVDSKPKAVAFLVSSADLATIENEEVSLRPQARRPNNKPRATNNQFTIATAVPYEKVANRLNKRPTMKTFFPPNLTQSEPPKKVVTAKAKLYPEATMPTAKKEAPKSRISTVTNGVTKPIAKVNIDKANARYQTSASRRRKDLSFRI